MTQFTLLSHKTEGERVNIGTWRPKPISKRIVSAEESLNWAKTDMKGGDRRAIGNALGNIKRSIHRRIDEIISNTHVPQAKDWSWFVNTETKLKILQKIGVEYRSIVNLITEIRNNYEHKYELPKLEDVRAYYEITELWMERSIERYTFYPAGIIGLPILKIVFNDNAETIDTKPPELEELIVSFAKLSTIYFFSQQELFAVSGDGSTSIKPLSEMTVDEIIEIESKYIKSILSEKSLLSNTPLPVDALSNIIMQVINELKRKNIEKTT